MLQLDGKCILDFWQGNVGGKGCWKENDTEKKTQTIEFMEDVLSDIM